MEQAIQKKLALFASNAQSIKKEFTWEDDLIRRMAALLYALEDKPADCGAIRQCHALIKENTGVFSAFRGNMALCVAALLSLAPDPQALFSETLQVYGLLKNVKLRASDYLVIAAYQIAAQSGPANHMNTVDRTRAFYNGLKAHHFFYTGEDDYIFAAMLGLSNLDVAVGTERIEQLHRRLKNEFLDKNSVQALTQVLALGGSDDDAVTRVLALRDAFRARKIRLDKSDTLPALGIFALLPVEQNVIVQDIEEAQLFLREQKGFGLLSITTQELLIFTSAMVASEYAGKMKEGILEAAVSISITNIVIAQQAALIAVIFAAWVVAATSSHSS